MLGWEIKLVLQSFNKDPKRREKFKKLSKPVILCLVTGCKHLAYHSQHYWNEQLSTEHQDRNDYHRANAELAPPFCSECTFAICFSLVLLHNKSLQTLWLKATQTSYLTVSVGQESRKGIAVFFAQDFTRLKSRCQPGLQSSPTGSSSKSISCWQNSFPYSCGVDSPISW